jgi:gliding motility-associated-like protein
MRVFLIIIGIGTVLGLTHTAYGQIIDLCPPVAADDSKSTNQNTPVTINVIANDADCPSDVLTGGAINPATVDLNTSVAGIQNSISTPQGNYSVDAMGIVTYTPALNFVGTASLGYTVNDKAGKTSNVAMITITVIAVNNPPVANAGPDKTITLPTNSVILNGSGKASNGSIASYLWTKISGGAATLTNANTANLTASDLVAGVYVFRLTVTDNYGAQGSADAKVTVNPGGNMPPIANAGGNKTITLPTNSVTLNGTGTDPDGSIASYSWTKVSGGAATLTNANTANLTASGLVVGPYVFRLTVTDNQGAQGSDDATVIVNPAGNAAPLANAGPDKTITLPVNSVILNGTGTDSDGSIASYSWIKVSGGAATLVNANTANLTASGLVAGVYTFRLTVTDNQGATGSDDVTVTVNDASANNRPVANNDTTRTSKNTPVMINVVANDTDSGGTINAATVDLNLSSGGIQDTNSTPQGNFSVNTTGIVTFTPTVDYIGVATVSYTVNDNTGATSNPAMIVIMVEEPPAYNDLDIPAGFTPNGDGANETWKILSRRGTDLNQFHNAEVRIYNKHGLLLYEAKGFESRWDGRQNGEVLPSDSYYYTIDLKIDNLKYKGIVTILR